MADRRRVRWFGCGAASATAIALDLKAHPGGVIAYCETKAEHPDNERFLGDCERWWGAEVIRLHSDEYEDTWDVWERRKFIAGPDGAPCTGILKVSPRNAFQFPDDIHVFGYTAHPRFSLVGAAIADLNEQFPDRWAIRFSVAPETPIQPMQATSIWRKASGRVSEGIVCPQSSGDTACCGTCGLCWNPHFADKRVVFLGHGMVRRKDPVDGPAAKVDLKVNSPSVPAPHSNIAISTPKPKPPRPVLDLGPNRLAKALALPADTTITLEPILADADTIRAMATMWGVPFRGKVDLWAVNKAAEKRGQRPFKLDESEPSKTKRRQCLNCGRPFESHGPGNRLCLRCDGRTEGIAV